MAKSALRIRARALRRSGESVKGIAKRLCVSRSSACTWCKDIVLSVEQVARLVQREHDGRMIGSLRGAKTNKEKRLSAIADGYQEARSRIGRISDHNLLLIGAALYWAEGSRKGRTKFDFANSDPRMVRLIIHWLQRCFGVRPEDFLPRIYINEVHQDRELVVRKHWARLLRVHGSVFRRTIYIHAQAKKIYENHDTHFGTLHLRLRRSAHVTYRVFGVVSIIAGMSAAECRRAYA